MSYIIKSTPNVLFIHIPKTAGNAIMTVSNNFYGTTHISNNRAMYGNYHSTLKDAENYIDNFDNIYSFTVVRNPWSRISSWYFFRKAILSKFLKSKKLHSKKVSGSIREVRHEYNLMKENFDKWLYAYFDQPWDYTWFKMSHNQMYWLKSSKINITKVIKYEELKTEFNNIPIFADQTLPVTNRSRSSSIPYNSVFSHKSMKFIEKAYQEDIDTFKYTF